MERSQRIPDIIQSTSIPMNNRIYYFYYILFFIFLLFIPFQKMLVKYYNLPKYFLYFDEIVSITFFFYLLIVLLNVKKIKKNIFILIILFIIFMAIGIISGLLNGNRILITFLGIFDYLKNFIYIIGCYYIFSNYKYLRLIYNILLKLAVIFVIVAIIQETIFIIGGNLNNFFVPFVIKRFGIMRPTSLLGHPNIFGLYILIFFTLNIFIKKKLNLTNVILLIGIFLSLSRFIWISALVIILIFLFEKRTLLYTILIFFFLIFFVLYATPYFLSHTSKELLTEDYFRGYALYKSIEIWNDNKMLGVGPGMYGGVISLMFNSPIYDKYNFSNHWYVFMKGFNSIDQFYPQLLAETGFLGFFWFISLLILLFKIPRNISKKIQDPFLKGLLKGLSKIPIVLCFYLLGSGLNMTAFLVTYTSLLGITLGVAYNENFINQ